MKTRKLTAYCFSFYGCELWDLSNFLLVQSLCVAWPQALRHIWKLPYNCHAAILGRLSGTVSLFDSLCNRSLNFVRKCLNCDNILVNFVSRHAVFYCQMCSVMGRNVEYFYERFGVCSLDVIHSSKQWKLMADEGIVCRAGMIQKLVMVRDGLLCMYKMSNDYFKAHGYAAENHEKRTNRVKNKTDTCTWLHT